MKRQLMLRVTVLLAALVGPLLAAVVTAAPATASVPAPSSAVAKQAPAQPAAQRGGVGTDCWGMNSANKQSNGTVKLHWEIFCPQYYYFRINLAPVLVNLDTGKTTYYQKDCASNNGINDCVFNTSVGNPAGTHRFRLMWDSSWNGSTVYASNGDRWVCNSPSGIYCGISNATW